MSVLPEEKEAALIARTDAALGRPVTREVIIDNLCSLGLHAGDVVLLHSSLSSLGWVLGSAETVIASIEDIIGEQGTLVMPSHSGHLSDPSSWEHPQVPESWIPIVRQEMPAFDPHITATRGMGAIPELFRTLPGVLRSNHPRGSFSARGEDAEFLTRDQSLDDGFGLQSPLEHLYTLNAKVLLLGVGHGSNTSLHLAEHHADWPGKKKRREWSPVVKNGRKIGQEYFEIDYDCADFPSCGAAFEATEPDAFSVGPVGLAEARLISQKRMVDFAAGWFSCNRPDSLEPNITGEVK